MKPTTENICILETFLHDIHGINCKYIDSWKAFYIKNRCDGSDVPHIYLAWDKVVEAYSSYIDTLLNIKH
jgi:hypothetical protein